MFGNQVFNHTDALQSRAGAQGLGHFVGLDASHIGNRGISLRRVVDLELDQHGAQVALVTCQRAVQQQGAFGLVELQQIGECIDVFSTSVDCFFSAWASQSPVAASTDSRSLA